MPTPCRTFTALSASILLLQTAAAAQRAADPTLVRERWCTAGRTSTHEFVAITGAIELQDGSFWVSDGRAEKVVELDQNGAVVKPVLRGGDGPGEVRGPFGYIRWTDGVFGLYDVQPSAISLFSPKGVFLRRISLATRLTNVKGMIALPARGFLISGGIAGNASSVHVFDSTGALTRSFHPVPVTKNPRAGIMVGGGAVSVGPTGTVWFSQSAPHLLARLDVARGTEEKFASDPGLIPAIGDDFISEAKENGQLVRSFKWYFPQSRSINQYGNRLLNIIELHDEHSSIWEIYDINSRRRVSSTRVPVAYSILTRTRDGDLIATKDDEDTGQISICRLQTSLGKS